jgi:hypothetical protein
MEERQIGCAAIGQGPRERRSSAPGGQLARLIDKTMDLQTTGVMARAASWVFLDCRSIAAGAGRPADANRQFQFHEYDDLPLGSTDL